MITVEDGWSNRKSHSSEGNDPEIIFANSLNRNPLKIKDFNFFFKKNFKKAGVVRLISEILANLVSGHKKLKIFRGHFMIAGKSHPKLTSPPTPIS